MSQIELSNCDSHCPSRLESWCVGWCDLRLFNSPHHHHYGDGPLLQTPPRKKHWLPNISIIDTYLVCVCVVCVCVCVLCLVSCVSFKDRELASLQFSVFKVCLRLLFFKISYLN